MYVKSGAHDAAEYGVFLLNALEILRAEGDAVGTKAAEAALFRIRKAHDAAYTEQMMGWARVGNSTTENLK